jgi:hypothetical protein
MTHLDILNTSYGQKKGRESNCQFDYRPLKVKNRLDFLPCSWHSTYRWKDLDEGYNFAIELISIGGFHAKLCAPKVARVSIVGILGQNDIWVLVPWPGIEYTIRGKVMASLKSGPWWVLWVCVYPWLICAPKCSNYALTNLLFGLCKFMWVIESLNNLASPILKLYHAPLP